MALPASGPISMSMVNTELGAATATTLISLNDAIVRTLFNKLSGEISLSDGYGKSAASAPVINSYSGTPSNICYYSENRNTTISWNVSAGALPITVYLQRAPYNTCSWGYAYGGAAIGTMSALGGFTITPANWHTGGVNMAYRLVLTNSSGTTTTGGVGVVADYCSSDTFCSYGDCQNQGSPVCYNCSEECTCSGCTYDTNCDCGTGEGTGGCGASCNCDWCSNYYNEDGSVNGDWPCPCGCQLCGDDCTCPCGTSCPGYQSLQTCENDQHGFWYGNGYSAC